MTNDNPSYTKRFNTVILKTNKKWDMPSAITQDSITYGTQETSLVKNEFSNTENLSSAQLKRDKNSPNFATPQKARLEGNEMRGQAMTIKLEREIDGRTVTFSVKVTGQTSEIVI